MKLSKKGLEVQKQYKELQNNLTTSVQIIKKCINKEHLDRFDENQIGALVLFVSYLGAEKFNESVVLRVILGATEQRIREISEFQPNYNYHHCYVSAGWQFESDCRMFAKDSDQGREIGIDLGRLFNTRYDKKN